MPEPSLSLVRAARAHGHAAAGRNGAGPRRDRCPRSLLRSLLGTVDALRTAALAEQTAHARLVAGVAPGRRQSAANLLHYLSIRRHDLRPLQRELARLGLSSLGGLESCTQHTLDAVASALRRLLGEPALPLADPALAPDADTGPLLLQAHARELLGPPPAGRAVRVMVTIADDDPALARALVAAGMDLARINTGHGDPARWTRIASHVRAAAAALGRPCRIVADLAGPKLRTGPLLPGAAVRRLRPERDELGRVLAPARAWFQRPDRPAGACPDGACPVPLAGPGLGAARPGDELVLRDARGRRRRFLVRSVRDGALLGECDRTSYVVPGTALELRRGGALVARASIAAFPPPPGSLELRAGDEFLLTRAQTPGGPSGPGERIRGRIPCNLAAVCDCARPGDPIWFDDGRLGGRIVGRDGPDLRVRVTKAPRTGFRLRAEKGINLPATELVLPALTGRDRANLDWIVQNADAVGLSFARSPADLRQLADELRARGAPQLPVILKIETRSSFDRLPALLLEGLRAAPLGVMIARGDLAVEVGFARLAELQEEILRLCEAAHVPVIWATQVLETLAHTGQPSRAEVSDAALGARAECVMLNKGPYADDAVRFLGDVLARMAAHHDKERALLDRLAAGARAGREVAGGGFLDRRAAAGAAAGNGCLQPEGR